MSPPDERPGVLVTGGTGALGRAVVSHLLDTGHEVVATWIVKDERDRLEADLGGAGSLRLVEADLTDAEAVGAAVAAAGSQLGAVVNLVGGYAGGHKVGETEPDGARQDGRPERAPALSARTVRHAGARGRGRRGVRRSVGAERARAARRRRGLRCLEGRGPEPRPCFRWPPSTATPGCGPTRSSRA